MQDENKKVCPIKSTWCISNCSLFDEQEGRCLIAKYIESMQQIEKDISVIKSVIIARI